METKCVQTCIQEKFLRYCSLHKALQKSVNLLWTGQRVFSDRSIKPFMSLDVLRSTHFAYVHSVISYGIIYWKNSSHSEEIFKVQNRIIRIIMNLSKNASCQQPFRELNILPVPSQYIISLLAFITKNKDKNNVRLTHKCIKLLHGKLLICTYPQ